MTDPRCPLCGRMPPKTPEMTWEEWERSICPESACAQARAVAVVECSHDGRHEHGHHLTYRVDGCRCDLCVRAYRRRRKAYELAREQGVRPRVDASRSREHVEQLLAGGLRVGQIESRSGVNRTTINMLRGVHASGRVLQQVLASTERRLLAVTADRFAGERSCLVDQTGTSRRVQALSACGWSFRLIAAELGLARSGFGHIAYGKGPVREATRRAVVVVYDRLWDQQPPMTTRDEKGAAARAAARAARLGWPPPLAWDDDTIDDPAAAPAHDIQPDTQDAGDDTQDAGEPDFDEVLWWRVLAGQRVHASGADRRQLITRWTGTGRPLNELDRIQGWNTRRDRRHDRQEAA